MDMFKVVGIGVSAAVLAVFVKNWKPELAMTISLIASAVMFFSAMPYLKSVVRMLRDISAQVGIESKYIRLILKLMGIAYIAQFGAELCRDAGETAIASKIEFAGKVIITAISFPVMYKLLELVNDIVRLG